MKTSVKFAIAMLVLLTSLPNYAAYINSGGITYNILSEQDRTVEVIDIDRYFSGDLVIPERFIYESKTYKVVAIGYGAFSCSDLASVTIPSSVTSIVTYAFNRCDEMTDIYVDQNNPKFSSVDGFLCSKDGRKLICCPAGKSGSLVIPGSVTEIEEYAFDFCKSMTSVTIPGSVTSIETNAFGHCESLTSITIPKSVSEIGNKAFYYCQSMTDIDVDADNSTYSSVNGILYDKGVNTLLLCPGGKSGSVIIPGSVTSIGANAFSDCSSLTSITFPESLTSIGDDAFIYCYGLTSITFPESLTSIGAYAFCSCSKVISITIPNSVTSIGERAFKSCKSLTDVTILGPVTEIMTETFYDCTALTSITLPGSLTSIGEAAFHWCRSLTHVTIPNSVTSIGKNSFLKCYGLQSVSMSASLTEIGVGAFQYCDLQSVSLPASLTSIGEAAFDGNSDLTSIYCQMQEPISCDPRFSDDVLMYATVYVPLGCKEKYEEVDPWRNFWNIEEKDYAGIDDVNVDVIGAVRAEGGQIITPGGVLTEVFDMQGQSVYRGYAGIISNLDKGIYFVRIGRQVTKIIL